MSAETKGAATSAPMLLPYLLETCDGAAVVAGVMMMHAQAALKPRLAPDGKVDSAAMDREQYAAHGFAWLATYAYALRATVDWATALDKAGKFGEREQLILQLAFAEYMPQIFGGIPMSQGEIVRPSDMGVVGWETKRLTEEVEKFREIDLPAARARLAELIQDGEFGDGGLEDEALLMVRDQFRRFAEDHREDAHRWHLKDELIPLEIIGQLAEMGVFGLTVPEEFGGAGLGKLAMCVVTEELSCGYIGLGSLGTRSEIAAELIRLGGTEEQKKYWLPKLASGEILPTAVFTEPNTGSDLGALKTRAARDGEFYKVTGNKTWITHAARADVMTLLARTDPTSTDYRGLSMFLAEKPRGTDSDSFPAKGMRGGEIPVLGYRGMKEYEIGFDGFEVPARNLLGGREGEGFKQLMATFESARIQTAARAVGVAQCAMELGLKYARERVQFGRPIYDFPRVHGKLAWMAVETMIARQLGYFAAREKDSGRRCDIPAGMAKLLAARVAWANADNALQIHGGNGFALEYPVSRVLCDARILNIFEGAAEIQAQVIARRLLEGAN
jgi:(2S)-methylsuccinyl-CoA dehydrogenase